MRLIERVSKICTPPSLDTSEPACRYSLRSSLRPNTGKSLLSFLIDADLCVACLACVRICPSDAIEVVGEAPLLRVVDESCIRCGECVPACPHKAVKVTGELGRALELAGQGTAALILSPESAAHFYPATPEQVINACHAAGFRVVTR